MRTVRRPAVAGTFYPARAGELLDTVDSLLLGARRSPAPGPSRNPKALVSPHAGYIYSGPTAALGYALLDSALIRRVVLLGPAHYVGVRGLAVPTASAFVTPLGEVEVDRAACEALTRLPGVVVSDAVHEPEHSLEVQLPFLQRVLGEFTVVPVVVGDAAPREVAAVLDHLWGGPETVVVISSDLSHYLPYEKANSVDADTLRRIMDLEWPLPDRRACGGRAINGLLVAAPAHRLHPHLVDHRNSGDTAGDPARVVGYASIAFTSDSPVPGRSGARRQGAHDVG